MRTTTTALLAIAALLGACGKEAKPPAKPAQTITVRSESQKQLSAAGDLDRAIALKRAIMASGSSCKRVATTGFVGPYKNMDMWTASCIDSIDRPRDWAIFVGADDSVQVRLCKDTQAVGLPACLPVRGLNDDRAPNQQRAHGSGIRPARIGWGPRNFATSRAAGARPAPLVHCIRAAGLGHRGAGAAVGLELVQASGRAPG